jgi:hypothetical protein
MVSRSKFGENSPAQETLFLIVATSGNWPKKPRHQTSFFYEINKYFDIKLLIVRSSRNGSYELSSSRKTNVSPIWMCHVNVKTESWWWRQWF